METEIIGFTWGLYYFYGHTIVVSVRNCIRRYLPSCFSLEGYFEEPGPKF
jgi:hypothetical protein